MNPSPDRAIEYLKEQNTKLQAALDVAKSTLESVAENIGLPAQQENIGNKAIALLALKEIEELLK